MTDNLTQEKELLRLVAEGDERAFASLVRSNDALVFTYINNIVRHSELAEELVNDIFLQVWLARESLLAVNNFGAYLFVLCRNYAVNGLKKELREKKRRENWEAVIGDSENVDEHRALDLIDEAVEQLPQQQKKVWVMSRREGKSYQEIESELKISKNTVKTHLQTAKASITEYVSKRIGVGVVIWFLL